MPKCSDVMTREPACCEAGESIARVASIMKKEDVGAVPVVDSQEDKKLIGIITDRDIVVKVVADGHLADRAVVRDAMTSQPVCCEQTDDVQRAVELMGERQVRRMPIVDAQGRLCGIIAQADVATRLKRDETTGELVEAISEPGYVRH
jgi:CBS domain-containing protein